MNHLDPHKPPDVFACSDEVMAEELESMEVHYSTTIADGSITVHAGFRGEVGGFLPVTVIESNVGGLHAVVVPGGSTD